MAGQEPVLRAPACVLLIPSGHHKQLLFRVRESLACLACEGSSLEIAANSTEGKKITDERSLTSKEAIPMVSF